MSYQVVIIGAGISGLYAACNLIDQGVKDIAVLEAQDRIGGRMHSISLKIPDERNKNKTEEKWIELGAQFCHGSYDNHLYNFCRNNKVPLLHASEEYPNTYECGLQFFTAPEGKIINPKEIPCAKLAEEISELLNDDEMSDEITPKVKNFSVGQYFQTKYQEWRPETTKKLAKKIKQTNTEEIDKTDPYFVSNAEILERIYYFLINELRDDNGCENLNELSVRSWCEFEDDYDEDCEDSDDEYQKDCHFKNGAQSVINVLAGKLSSENIEIRLNTPALTISNWDDTNKIQVTCGDGQNQGPIKADHVICTVPLGYLKENHATLFDPPLPIVREKALTLMSFGSICKVFLEFENPLPKHLAGGFCLLWPKSVVIDEWKEYGENAESVIFDKTNWYRQLFIFHKVVKRPSLLLGWISGRAAKVCEELKDEEILEDIKENIFKKIIHKGDHRVKYPNLKAVHVSRWSCNPYIRGTYSYRTISADLHEISPKDLAEPLLISKDVNGQEVKCPRVLFAGEATDYTRYGTMDGAMQSGKREAKRINDYLKLISNSNK